MSGALLGEAEQTSLGLEFQRGSVNKLVPNDSVNDFKRSCLLCYHHHCTDLNLCDVMYYRRLQSIADVYKVPTSTAEMNLESGEQVEKGGHIVTYLPV